jgi:hypothetical protein
MKSSHLLSTTLGGLIALSTFGMTAAPAAADTGSTIAIAAGAAAIVGALLSDSSGRSYYVQGNQRHYVSHDQAVYYRSHHGNGNMGHGGNMGRGNMGHGNMGHDDHHDHH